MLESKQVKQHARFITRPILAGAVAMTALSGASADAANIFMKITPPPTIMGESQTKGHEAEIELISFSAGLGASVKDPTTLRVSKGVCTPLSVMKQLDKASGPL